MSRTTIVHIFPNEKIEVTDTEFSNSFGSAMVIWSILSNKYLHFVNGVGDIFASKENSDALWNLYKDKALPSHVRAVLMMTFDLAYVAKENYHRASDDIKRFMSELARNYTGVNHWGKIAEYFSEDPDVPGVGIWHTSVSECPYFEYDYENEKKNPRWGAIFEIYEVLDGLDSESEKKE